MNRATRSFFLLVLFIVGAVIFTAPIWFRDVIGPALEDTFGIVPTTAAFGIAGFAIMITTACMQ